MIFYFIAGKTAHIRKLSNFESVNVYYLQGSSYVSC